MMRALRAMPLSLRLPLLASALMVLVGAVASQQVLSALARVQAARLQELARMHVEGLSVALGPLVQRGDVWEVYDTLDRASQASAGQRMILTAVADASGRVLAATDPRRVPVDSPLAAIAEGAVPLERLTAGGAAPQVRLQAPLVYQGRRVGQIVTELDISDLLRERWQALVYLLAGNALVTGLLVLVGYGVMRRMLRPVAVLSHHMSDTRGQPDRIPAAEIPPGDGEMARLARTYNAMVDAVAAKTEAERRLAERERFVALGRLSSSLAHEINNPLGGLLNATDTIRAYADRPEVVRESAELLDRGLRHLRDVARVTLDQNRLDREGSLLSPGDFEDLRLLILPERTRMEQSLDWRVAAPAAVLARWHSGPVRQIALNLLLNASAAAGRGGRIGLTLAVEGAGLRLAVHDSGEGMPEAARLRLMTDADFAPGGGVGLRLVRDLVRDLGGGVELDRDNGQTRVAVTLPMEQRDAEA